MGLIKRLEKQIEKIEKKIQKNEDKIRELKARYDAKKITRAEFNIKKQKYEAMIHGLNARIRVLKGGIAREKRKEEEEEE
jgi:chromosome segregation ATPase